MFAQESTLSLACVRVYVCETQNSSIAKGKNVYKNKTNIRNNNNKSSKTNNNKKKNQKKKGIIREKKNKQTLVRTCERQTV